MDVTLSNSCPSSHVLADYVPNLDWHSKSSVHAYATCIYFLWIRIGLLCFCCISRAFEITTIHDVQGLPCSGCGSSGCGTLTEPTGSFGDGSGANNYTDNAKCNWIIAPLGAARVTLTLRDVDTEQHYDFIRVWQCNHVDCSGLLSLLASLDGKYSSPIIVTSTTGYMLVQFTTDGSITSSGFTASWETVLVIL